MFTIYGKDERAKSIDFTVSTKQENATIKYRKHKIDGLIPYYSKITNREFEKGLEISEGKFDEKVLTALPSHIQDLIKHFENNGSWKVIKNKCFLNLEWQPNGRKFGFSTGISPSAILERTCKRVIHLPGLRGNPERTYKKIPIGSTYSGTFEKYTASLISKWASSPKMKSKIDLLEKYLTLLGLCSHVETKRIDDTNFEILVSRLPVGNKSSNDSFNLVNIADVGFGVSQTLPILVALIAAKEEQIVYIEQPEIHLHPNAQWLFAKIIAESIARGVIVIIETHSSILIRGIQTLVAKGDIKDGKDISLHWFSRNTQTGCTEIDSSHLDEMGAFGEWPADFDDIALKAEQEYLDAVEDRYAKM